jgi:predicted membrane-bound dolichyl-phosphate-mannose-protein mannosyltransferase
VKRLLCAGALLVLLATFWLQMFLALPKLSATTDEVPHLPAGYTYWTTRDFRMNPEHPPLAKLLAALPLLAIKPHLDLTWPEWKDAQQSIFGYGFLYTNDADRLLFWGRLPMTLLATFGGLVVFLWAREMFGLPSGLFALALFAFSPNLLAHGMLVTTDVPLAVFMTLALYLLWRQGNLPSLRSSALVGLATGAAMACKFSGVILPLVIIAFSAYRVFWADDRRRQAVTEAQCLVVAGISALLVIEASFLFSTPPWTYFVNMRAVNANHNPNRLYYLFGNFSRSEWWYYFPFAFAVKATLSLLLTIVLAAVYLGFKKFIDKRGEVLLLTAIIAYVVAVMIGADDLGVRYLLPVFPLLYIWGSRIVVDLKQKSAGIAMIAVLLAWQAWAALHVFPNYIGYFNEVAGGGKAGLYYLDDSNVDWGQGVKQAAEYVRSHGLQNVEMLPFSPFENPRYYGIDRPRRDDLDTYRMMISEYHHPGTYIVSSHHLIRMMYIRPEWNPRNAIDRIGESMWVFRF